MATITLDHLRKVFPGKPPTVALEGLDLHVEDGEMLILVGPSGCGKTTALRCVAGLEKPTSGKILIGDREVQELPPRRRDVAMVFQNYALYPHLSVYQNLAFGLKEHRVARAEVDRRVREMAGMLGLDALLDRKPGQLSGGQSQRVAMGRALVREPQVFLLDEPLSNLDAKLRAQMRSEILALQRRVGVTSLYVTHDQAEAMTLGDRIAVLNAGRLQQLGTPEEVFRRPRNLFVAAFMGTPTINLLRGTVEAGVLTAGMLKLAVSGTGGARGDSSADAGGGASGGGASGGGASGGGASGGVKDGPVVLGFRPEALVPAREGAGLPQLVMQVDLIEELGNETLVFGSVPGEVASIEIDATLPPPLPGARARVAARLRGFSGVKAGEKLPLALRLDALHLFDATTGEALRLAVTPSASTLPPEPQALTDA